MQAVAAKCFIASPNDMLCLGGDPTFGVSRQGDQTLHMDIKSMNACGTHFAVGVLFSVTHTIFAC